MATSAVIGVPDDGWGERVHAVVVLKPGASATLADLRQHAKTLIAGYKAPRSVEFVDVLPLAGAGKVLKRELRARYEAKLRRSHLAGATGVTLGTSRPDRDVAERATQEPGQP